MSWYKDVTGESVVNPSKIEIQSPEGFNHLNGSKSEKTAVAQKQHLDALKIQKSWDIATGTAKQIPMTLFMNYMSGNALQLIPISMTLMLFANAFKAIMDVNKAFTGLETDKPSNDLALAKITYIFFQLVSISIGVYKLNSMGLIPNQTGDWLSWETAGKYIENTL